MRHFMIPIALIAGLGLAPAFAATTPAPSASPAAPAYSAATQTAAPVQDKKAACEKSWAAEKHHNGTKAAFLKSCIAKG